METRKVLVTPELAEAWLKLNRGNRPVQARRVRMYADDITSGNWKLTHQGIAFSEDGTLIDGQHRLRAVILAGVPVEMLVTRGCDSGSFVYLDGGAPRKAGDHLNVLSIKNATTVAGIARAAWVYGMRQERSATNAAITKFALQNMTNIDPFVELSRQFTCAVAGAFAFASMRRMSGVLEASQRLFSLSFYGDGDPMRALARRLSAKQGWTAQSAGRERFEVTYWALKAVNDGRDLLVARATEIPREDSLEVTRVVEAAE